MPSVGVGPTAGDREPGGLGREVKMSHISIVVVASWLTGWPEVKELTLDGKLRCV